MWKCSNTTYGHHHGQTDASIGATDANGNVVGYLDYSVFDGRPAIKMIETVTAYGRRGVASAMLARLQHEFPGVTIDWGSLTSQGEKLYANVPMKRVPSKSAPDFARLQRIRARLAEVTAICNANPDPERDSPELQAWRTRHHLENRVDELEDRLFFARREEVLIDIDQIRAKQDQTIAA